MDPRFLLHNSHLEGIANFTSRDPNLQTLAQQAYVYTPQLLAQLPNHEPGIYTLGGGCQVGKTTLTKQWMLQLLESGTQANSIAFVSGELIMDMTSLLHVIQTQLAEMLATPVNFLVIDEITYVKDWDRAIKYAADAGLLRDTILLLTGSDLAMMQDARIRFPGRRGKADVVDFHYYPLSFREYIELIKLYPDTETLEQICKEPEQAELEKIYQHFDQYLMHGGYLSAINDFAEHQQIKTATLATYSDWIRGDVVKRGKNETFLREILGEIIKRYNTQISWNAIVSDLAIDHPQTVIDYCTLLERMDALFIQSALIEDKLVAAPKKAKKLLFTDPFIFHAIRAWLEGTPSPFDNQIKPAINDPKLSSLLVEACVVSHYRRYYPTYYIKAEGEIDVAFIKDKRFWPIEVKWHNQIRPKELKQIKKYKNSQIYSKVMHNTSIDHVPIVALPIALLSIPVST